MTTPANWPEEAKRLRRILEPIEERFWPKVRKTEGCWLWTASLDGSGYGRIQRIGAVTGAHRVSWELHYGPIPSGMSVLHKCDVRNCVRPDHLFLGTNADNMRDMREKGRSHAPRPQPPGTRAGERNGRSKLTPEQVHEIRRRYPDSTLTALADEYGVVFSTIHRIVAGRGWRDA